jgi:hypothetical protein
VAGGDGRGRHRPRLHRTDDAASRLRRAATVPGRTRVALLEAQADDHDVPIGWQLGSLLAGSGGLEPLGADAVDVGWSPDGTKLRYVPADSPGTLIERDLETGDERSVIELDGGAICDPVARVASAVVTDREVPGGEVSAIRPFERGTLAPGTYSIDRFRPRMVVTLPSGWYADRNYVDGWSLSHLGSEGALSAALIRVGLTGPCDNDEQVVIGADYRDLIEWVSSRADLDVSSPEPVNIGGHAGISVDIEPRKGEQCDYSGDWSLFYSGEDLDLLREDQALRLASVDVGGTSVAFLVIAPKDGIAAFSERARSVTESIQFVDG